MGHSRDKERQKDLLEYLASEMGCQYLSDLRRTRRTYSCRCVLASLTAEDYPMQEWEDAVWYIAEEKQIFDTQEEARQWLIRFLKGKKEN